jgi:CBS-domain-containing membrane protein
VGAGLLLTFTGDAWNGIWFVALGLLMGQAAGGAVAQTAFAEKLRGVTVADIMDSEPVTIPAGMVASEAWEDYFLRYGWEWFAVTEGDGRLVGPALRGQTEHAVEAEGGTMPMRELVAREGAHEGRVSADATLEALLGSEPLRRLGALMAVDERGRLRGVVTLDQVTRALQAKLT